jgi:LysM repeat protein
MKIRRWTERLQRKLRSRTHLVTAAASTLVVVLLLAATGLVTIRGVAAFPFGYLVRPGDTVSQIAIEKNTTVDEVVRLNNLASADEIYVGQELRFEEPAYPSSETAAGSSEPSAQAEMSYVVDLGDTLWNLALRYGVDFDALIERNALPDHDVLEIGQKLIIPSPDARATSTTRGGERDNPGGRIWMPFRSQLDGSPYAGSNCGPATLGMLMSYFDEWWLTQGIRRDVNKFQGTTSYDSGSSWEAIAYAARERGFQVVGLYDGAGNYRQWTIEDMVEQTRAGRPVMVLVRYWSLPGHGDSSWWGDHYIAFVGLTPSGDVIYHDAAFPGEGGAYLMMSQERLIRAWTRTATGLQYTALALDWPGE